MSEGHVPKEVEDYTVPFLVSFGTLLFSIGFVVMAVFGLIWVAIGAWGLDQLFKWIGGQRR